MNNFLNHDCVYRTSDYLSIRYDHNANYWVMQDVRQQEVISIDFCPFCGFSLPVLKNKDLIVGYDNFIRDLRDNHDHDEDAHRYKTYCYVCEAEKLIGVKK